MGSEAEPQQSSIPKLSLFSLPIKPPEPPGILTPPLQTPASVPFQWEEAPGKPRVCAISKPKAARCLDLPPRLLTEAGKTTNTPSPTTVLDGPYSDRSLFHTMSFSLGKASFIKERVNFSSWRWGSFKDNGGDTGGNFDFSPSIGGCPECDECDVSEVIKITRVKKRKSFFGSSKTNLWASIYESVKQAVPWRRKQEKL
ncbi:uncharacterized protein At4g00950 [Actinidia eriantha]|nr:uncharacterized protein At4g00950 [Actinidia eriantha]